MDNSNIFKDMDARKSAIKEETESLQKSFQKNPEMEKLAKGALTADYGITPATQVDGGALKVESLDPVLKNLTWGTNDLTILPDLINLGIITAKSTVEKYVVFEKHGRYGHSLFQPEIGIGNVNSPHMKQKTVNMKNLVDVKQASFIMQTVSTIEDAMKINEDDAVATIAKTQEWAIFHGDADLTGKEKGEGLQFDGLDKLMDPDNVIDVRGGSLTPELLNKAAVTIASAFGTPTDAYMPVGVKADFGNQYLGAQRISIPSSEGLTAGYGIDRFISSTGEIALHGSTVMDYDNILDESKRPQPQAPAPAVLKGEVVAGSDGKFREDKEVADKDGNKYLAVNGEVGKSLSYKVVVVGHYGDSQASEAVEVTPTKADDGIKLTASLTAMQAELPDYVAFYRKGLTTDKYYLVGRVATRDIDDEGNIVFTDTNETIPETGDVYVLELRNNVISLMQLIPLAKFDLAVNTTANSFAVMWSGALRLSNPFRVVRLHNVRENIYTGVDENHLNNININGYGK